jgi:hypothetical protein
MIDDRVVLNMDCDLFRKHGLAHHLPAIHH